MVCTLGRLSGVRLVAGLALLALATFSTRSFAESNLPGDAIRWKTSYKAAVEEARRTGKSVYVHVSAVWCGPCQQMKANTFNAPRIRKLFSEAFVPCLLDADKEPDLIQQFKVAAYPTGIVVSPDLIIRKHIAGSKSAADLEAILAQLPAPRPPVPEVAAAVVETPASALAPENAIPFLKLNHGLVSQMSRRDSGWAEN